MTKAIQTIIGIVLITVGAFAFIKLENRSEYVALALIGFGSFMVSQSVVINAIKAAKELLPWRSK